MAVLITLVFFVAATIYWLSQRKHDPLNAFPGPGLWGISRLPYVAALISGRLPQRVKELHDLYGPIVRIAPQELSFINEAAWADIYSGQPLNEGFPKNDIIVGAQGYPSIIDADSAEHFQLRKLLAPALSSQAVRHKEPVLHKYIEVLIGRLRTKIHNRENEETHLMCQRNRAVVDMVKWLNFFTFDVVGDVIYSESFGCLSQQRYSPWIKLILDYLRSSSLLIAARFYTPLDKIMDWMLSHFFPSLAAQKSMFITEAFQKAQRRIDRSGENLADLVETLRSGLTQSCDLEKIKGNATLLSIAGSETVSTVLASIFGCIRPEQWLRLALEVRELQHDADLTLANLEKLPYLTAVITEALRIGVPVPTGIPRVVPVEGAIIADQFVPGGTIVGVSPFSAYYSDVNFARPVEYLPERWLERQEVSPEFAHDKREILRPFFVGRRNCLGQTLAWAQMRLVLAHIVWHFDVTRLRDSPWQDQKCYYLWNKKACFCELSVVERPLTS